MQLHSVLAAAASEPSRHFRKVCSYLMSVNDLYVWVMLKVWYLIWSSMMWFWWFVFSPGNELYLFTGPVYILNSHLNLSLSWTNINQENLQTNVQQRSRFGGRRGSIGGVCRSAADEHVYLFRSLRCVCECAHGVYLQASDCFYTRFWTRVVICWRCNVPNYRLSR